MLKKLCLEFVVALIKNNLECAMNILPFHYGEGDDPLRW